MGPWRLAAWVTAGLLWPATLLAAAADLAVTQAGPVGEIAKLEEANEIRVVVSDPMMSQVGRGRRVAAQPRPARRFRAGRARTAGRRGDRREM